MSDLLLQKIVLLRVTEVGKIILKKKRPLLLARSVYCANASITIHIWQTNHGTSSIRGGSLENQLVSMYMTRLCLYNDDNEPLFNLYLPFCACY